jgi:hypothetical protein
VSGDEVRCPFCDRNVWWGGEEGGPCEHLLADWALDPEDNGGGVLGETLSGGIPGAENLDTTSQMLCDWVWNAGMDAEEEMGDADEETVKARLKLATNAIAGEKPAWWWELHQAILEWPKPEPRAQFANPMVEAIVQNLPGISISYETLGGMTSGTSIFVWSDDPVAGWATIDAAVASVIRTVEMVPTPDDSDS